MLSNKRKFEENAMVFLTEECSDILQNKPPKLKGPGSFSILCVIEDITISRVFSDVGASLSLTRHLICKRLQVGELEPNKIPIQRADRSGKYPIGVLEDVPFQAGKFFIFWDFIVMEMEENA